MKRHLALVPELPPVEETRTTTHHLPADLYDMIFGTPKPRTRNNRHLTLVA